MPYKRGAKWVGCVKRNYVKREKICESKTEALAWENDQKRLPLEKFLGKTDMVSLAEWANSYLDYAIKFSEKTYKEKKSIFKRFFKMLNPAQSVNALSNEKALAYLDQQFKDRGGNSANKDRKNLATAFKWGQTFKGMPSINPFRVVPKYPEKRTPRYVTNEVDFWKVYNLAERKDQVMLLTFLHLAGRRSEIFRIHRSDVDFEKRQIRLWTRKREGGSMEGDWLPMTDALFELLLEHLKTQSNEWIFPNPETGLPYTDRKKWLLGLCLKAHVKPFGFHSIRHLTPSIMIEAGVSGKAIQGVLRHKKFSTTERYLHQLTDLRLALKVFENKSPSPSPSQPGDGKTKLMVVK